MQTELYGELLSILSEIVQVDLNAKNGLVSRRELSEWDSVNHLRFALELEERFGITIKDEEWADLMSLREVESLLERDEVISSRGSDK